jgi:WD40 repeat protein
MTFEGHTGNITGVAFHCEGKWMVTSSEDGTVKVWDTRSGTEQRNYKHASPVNDVVIHPNQGELITASRDGSVQVWDIGESIRTHSMTVVPDVSMACVSVGSDGTILAAGNNRASTYPSAFVSVFLYLSGRCLYVAYHSRKRANRPIPLPKLQSTQRVPDTYLDISRQ